MLRLSIHAASIVGALCLLPAMCGAESRAITLEEQAMWNAVGRLNKGGPDASSGCTATLISPDLIISAGHCAPVRSTEFDQYMFVAGWHDGAYVAISHIKDVYYHPNKTSGPLSHDTVYADVALLRLETPLSISPMPIGRVPDRDFALAFLAYRNNGSQVPMLRENCQHRAFRQHVTTLDCEVFGGNSGAPLLDLTPVGPRVIGVISAKWGNGALAVNMQDWMSPYLPELPSSIFE